MIAALILTTTEGKKCLDAHDIVMLDEMGSGMTQVTHLITSAEKSRTFSVDLPLDDVLELINDAKKAAFEEEEDDETWS